MIFLLIILLVQSCGHQKFSFEFNPSYKGGDLCCDPQSSARTNSGRNTVARDAGGPEFYHEKRSPSAKELVTGMKIEIAFFIPLFFLLEQHSVSSR